MPAKKKKKRSEESEQSEGIELKDKETEPKQEKTERPAECRFNDRNLAIFERVGLIPLALFASASILASFFNIYEWGRNNFNILFMSLAALSLAVYELMMISAIRKCKCEHCKSRAGTSLIFLLIGLVGFIAGLAIFCVYP